MTKHLIILLFGMLFAWQAHAQPQAQAPAQDREPPRDSAWEELAVRERAPIPLPHVREGDVLWARRLWQVIDLREKMNQPLYFPPSPTGNMRSLMQVLLDGIESGELIAYSVDTDDFSIPMTHEELMGQLRRTQTITMQRPTPPYEEFDTVVTISFEPSDVMRFRIKEDWFFDAKRSMLDVRILGICPVRESIDPITGESRGDEPLFWIYYPHAREVLANAPVFNRHNDAQRISFDDLFLRRFFSATVYKASNVQDRRIAEYYSGEEALREAQRIIDEIRNFEHDLWEY